MEDHVENQASDKEYTSAIDGLRRLLESGETANIRLSLQILNAQKIPSRLWTLLFGLVIFHPESEIRDKAFKLYDQNALVHWPRSFRAFNAHDELDVSLFLEELCTDHTLDAKDLGKIALILEGLGAKFCLEKAILPPEEVFRKIAVNNTLDLSNFQLRYLPPEIGKLRNLESLDISNNLFEDVPDEIRALSRLEYLYLDHTPLNKSAEEKLEKFFPKIFASQWFSQAVNRFYDKDFSQSLEALNHALRLDSSQASYWNTKGVVLGRLHREEEALPCFMESLRIDPSEALTYSNYSQALHELGLEQESLEIAQKAIDLLENNPQLDREWYSTLYFRKGQALFHLKLVEDSIKAYDKAILLNPEDGSSWYNQGCNYAYLNDHHQAIQHIKCAIKLNPVFKSEARRDPDFSVLLNNADFQEVIS